jgi:hypothetical protein
MSARTHAHTHTHDKQKKYSCTPDQTSYYKHPQRGHVHVICPKCIYAHDCIHNAYTKCMNPTIISLRAIIHMYSVRNALTCMIVICKFFHFLQPFWLETRACFFREHVPLLYALVVPQYLHVFARVYGLGTYIYVWCVFVCAFLCMHV